MRLSELYTSMQCEGPNTGKMVQFVRFAGCNMKCPGWPCDTQHAIDPAIYGPRGTQPADKLSPPELLDMVQHAGPFDLCLTGGEPFLQREAELQEFVEGARNVGYNVECFSNGSFNYPIWALSNMQFIMDWKLKGSGESNTARDVRERNALKLKRSDAIKFVCVDAADFTEATWVYRDLHSKGCQAQFWIGAAWDRMPIQQVIDFVEYNRLPFRINVQLHKLIWDPEERGV